nr:MAG TPA: hypothetical protein [Caudoviricetes sp.]
MCNTKSRNVLIISVSLYMLNLLFYFVSECFITYFANNIKVHLKNLNINCCF